jgi:hypothetical protein
MTGPGARGHAHRETLGTHDFEPLEVWHDPPTRPAFADPVAGTART